MRYKLSIKAGDRFNSLTALNCCLAHRFPSRAKWFFKCDCGRLTKARIGDVINNTITRCVRCGAHAASQSKLKTEHVEDHPLYGVWKMMHQRCTNPNCKDYVYYGGRGISVCTQWNTFKNFVRDLGDKPSPEYTLDRIDVNGNYEPRNIRWATRLQQTQNRR